MKLVKLLWTIFFAFIFSFGFGQKKINAKAPKEYWFSGRLSDSLSGKKIPDPSQGFPIQAFLVKKNKLYYQPTIGDEIIPVSLKPLKGSERILLDIGETMTNPMFDYSPKDKAFNLIKRPNEMILIIKDKNGLDLDSIAFLKPIDFLMGKDVSEIFFAHLMSGNYQLDNSDKEVTFDIAGNLYGINGFSKWNVVRTTGKVSPKINSTNAFVVLETSNKKKESFLVVFDELIKTMNFYKYTILKDGTYSLEKQPHYILKQS